MDRGWEKPMSQKRDMGHRIVRILARGEKQIPFGDDNQKGKSKSNCYGLAWWVNTGRSGL
jgi:hypothetical protein